MNIRELLIGLALLCQFSGQALIKNAPNKDLWWIGSFLQDLGTPLLAAVLLRDKRNRKDPAAKKDLPPKS